MVGGTSEIITGPLPLILTAYKHVIDSDGASTSSGGETWLAFHTSGAAFLVVMTDDDGLSLEGTYSEANGNVTLIFPDFDFTGNGVFTFDPSATEVTLPFKVFDDATGTSTWTRAAEAELLPLLFDLFFQGITYYREVDPATAINFAAAHADALVGTDGKGGVTEPVIERVERLENGIEVHYADPPQDADPRQPLTMILFPTVSFSGQDLTPNFNYYLDPEVNKNLPPPGNPIDDPSEKTAVFIAPFYSETATDWYDRDYFEGISSTPAAAGEVAPLAGNISQWISDLEWADYRSTRVVNGAVNVENLIEALVPVSGGGGQSQTPGFIFFQTHGTNGKLALGIKFNDKTPDASVAAEYAWLYTLYPDLITYDNGTLKNPKTLRPAYVKDKRNEKKLYLTVTPLFWKWLRNKGANFNKSFVYTAACHSAGEPNTFHDLSDPTHELARSIKARAFFGHKGEPTNGLQHALLSYFIRSLRRYTHTAEEAYYNIILIRNSGKWIYNEDRLLDRVINHPVVGMTSENTLVGYGLVGDTAHCFWENGWLNSTNINPGGLFKLLFYARKGINTTAASGAQKLKNCWDDYWSQGTQGNMVEQLCRNMTGGYVPRQDEVAYASYLLVGTPVVPFSEAVPYARFTLHDGE